MCQVDHQPKQVLTSPGEVHVRKDFHAADEWISRYSIWHNSGNMPFMNYIRHPVQGLPMSVSTLIKSFVMCLVIALTLGACAKNQVHSTARDTIISLEPGQLEAHGTVIRAPLPGKAQTK